MIWTEYRKATKRSQSTQTLQNKRKHDFWFQWGWISCIRCEKFGNDFVAWTLALIAPVQPTSHRVSGSNEMVPNAPNTTKRNKSWVWGPMGRIRCIRCKNFLRKFVARYFEFIGPFQPVFHWVYCLNKTNPNARKHYEMQQKLSLGSNLVDWVRSLWKHLTRLCGTNFSFCTEFRAVTKWSQMHPNTMKRNKRWVWGPMGSIGCVRCENIRCDFVA